MKHLIALLPLVLLVVLCSCARTNGDGDGDGDADGDADCTVSDDCDDSVDCTFDSCEAGACAHEPIDALCADGETCDPQSGCQGGSCGSDEDCDDGFDCTFDFCESGGTCTWRVGAADCPEGQECRLGQGCVARGCTGDEECADELGCTIDLCNSDNACEHVPDNSRCEEGETCRAGTGCRVYDCESDEDCQDGIFCNGQETCHPEFGCMDAEASEDCNDNEECTLDHCDPELDRCVYDVNTALPECDTFELEHMNGCFSVTPNISQSCIVRFDFNQVCFELVGPVLTIQAGPYRLTQSPAPVDANFNAFAEVAGGCKEVYTLTGTFSGSSTFSGTWTSQFINVDGFSCLLGGCANRTIPVTGTRL